jgi:hypothetical protein
MRARRLVAAGGARSAAAAGLVLATSTRERNTRHRGHKPCSLAASIGREAYAHMLTGCRRGRRCRGTATSLEAALAIAIICRHTSAGKNVTSLQCTDVRSTSATQHQLGTRT